MYMGDDGVMCRDYDSVMWRVMTVCDVCVCVCVGYDSV